MVYLISKSNDGTAKAVPVSYPVELFAVVYGLPTTGKSEFSEILEQSGLKTLDTDKILDLYFPEWGELKVYSVKQWNDLHRALYSFLMRGLGCIAGRKLEKGVDIILTNVIDKKFSEMLFSGGLQSRVIGFTRSNTADIKHLWEYRGAHGPETSFLNTWRTKVSDYCGRSISDEFYLVDLSTGLFLGDYLAVNGNKVQFEPIGMKPLMMTDESKDAALKGDYFFQTRWFIAEMVEYFLERGDKSSTSSSRGLEMLDVLGCMVKFEISSIDLGSITFAPSLYLLASGAVGKEEKVFEAVGAHYEQWAEKQASRGREVLQVGDLVKYVPKFTEIINKSFRIS